MAKDNHHYVPKGYLRGFTIEGEKSLIWEYDKNTGGISRQPKSISYICSEHHYYAQKNEDGTVDHESMENAFHYIEDKAPRIIAKIEFPGTGKKVILTDKEREILSFFAAIQLFRVPNFREGIEELHRRVVEVGLDYIVNKDKEEEKLPRVIEELYKQGKIKIDIEQSVSLEPMINMAKTGACRLLEKVWHFAAPASGMTFVTSDNPVYFQTPAEHREQVGPQIGPMHPFSEVTLPLRKDLLLIFSPSFKRTPSQCERLGCTSVQLDKADTKNMNKRTALAAAQYVYSSEKSEALARMVGKLRGSSQRVVV
ncbi:DUF4238 domain-containing protein [Spongiibacter sp. KMU-166]|uniref:DUF4238 domain-containing protein n=1 Tax=Spongiibacter thalassae TaxID=2721624 RepID=A0ABX1GJ68_9GAMM|nr:DUF4238 domain-containing protein [Spongiibacter thalassae]NKI19243.1 DUF4238 domain-containing protein [Spongiibacter thalassae]